MSSNDRSALRGGLAAALLLLISACGPGSGPDLGPIVGPLTGTWRGPMGVDTGARLVLEEHGRTVVGQYDAFSPVQDITAPLTGQVDLPNVSLGWKIDGAPVSARLVLAPDNQSLAGTVVFNGEPPAPFGPFSLVP